MIDFLAYNLPAGATLTKWPLFIVAGIFVAIIYYVVFKFLIVKFNFKTPGREEEVSDEIENAVAGNVSDAETGRMIIEALGGKENILEVENCFTRLRVSINDSSVVDEVALKRTGALGVVKKDKHVQVVYGTKVPQIRSTVDSLLKKSV